MACTTLKVLPKNRVVSDRFEAYCQAVHVNRLLSVKPAIDTRLEHGGFKHQRKQRLRHKAARAHEHTAFIQLKNERIMRKILAAHSSQKHSRSQVAASLHSDTRLADIARNNLRHQRLESARNARARLQEENESMMRRLLAVRPTINVKTMEKQCRERSKLLRNRARKSRNRVLDLSDLTLQAALKRKSPLFPKPPPSKPQARRFRKRRVRLREKKLSRENTKNQEVEVGETGIVRQVLNELVMKVTAIAETSSSSLEKSGTGPAVHSKESSAEEVESLAKECSEICVREATIALQKFS